jgi:hypothetical protein
VTVCVAGITNGQGDAADAVMTTGVEAWWRTFFHAAGATLASYGGSLDGCPLHAT